MTTVSTTVGENLLEEMAQPSQSIKPERVGCNLKNDKMISVHFQGKPFNITVMQVYAPNTNAEEVEVEWVYDDPQTFLN